MELVFLAIAAIILALVCIRQVNQYERGVMLTLGRYTGMKAPGWRIVIPVFQRMIKVDLRVKAVDVPDQKVITKDNVTIDIDAVLYYRVAEPQKATYAVQNLPYGAFRRKGSQESFRPGVAIGDQILDLAALAGKQPFEGLAADALAACATDSLNALMALGQSHWSALRLALSRAG